MLILGLWMLWEGSIDPIWPIFDASAHYDRENIFSEFQKYILYINQYFL